MANNYKNKFLSGEGLKQVWSAVKQQVAIDSESIVRNSEGKLSVPIDGETIIINSEGLLESIQDLENVVIKVGSNKYSTLVGKEAQIGVDGITIKYNTSTKQLEATGLSIEAGDAVEVVNSGYTSEGDPIKRINVLYDDDTIILDSEGNLKSNNIFMAEYNVTPIEDILEAYDAGKNVYAITDKGYILRLTCVATNPRTGARTVEFSIVSNDSFRANLLTAHLSTNSSEWTTKEFDAQRELFTCADDAIQLYNDSENNQYIRVLYDNDTITLNSEGKLVASGSVANDDKTIILNSEGLIETKIGGWEDDLLVISGNIITDSEAVPINPGSSTFKANVDTTLVNNLITKLTEAGKTSFKLTLGMSLPGTFTSTNVIKLSNVGEGIWEGYCTVDETDYRLLVREGYLRIELGHHIPPLPFPVTAVQITNSFVNESIRVIHYVDNNFISHDSTISLTSEGKLSVNYPVTDVLYNETREEEVWQSALEGTKAKINLAPYAYVQNTANNIRLSRSSDNILTTKLRTLDGDVISTATVQLPKVDNSTLLQNSESTLIVNIDNSTIILNSEGKLSSVPEPLVNGVATEVKYLTSGEETVNVKFDNDTIVLNSEGKLKAVIENLTAGEAIFVDSENAINVKYDDDTIILNSEGKLAVAIDNKTLLLNSEGLLETKIGGWEAEPTIISGNLASDSEAVFDSNTTFIVSINPVIWPAISTLTSFDVNLSVTLPGWWTESGVVTFTEDPTALYSGTLDCGSEGRLDFTIRDLATDNYLLINVGNHTCPISLGSVLNINKNSIYRKTRHIHYVDNDFILTDSTIATDSEGKLIVPIDNSTIVLNSEGELEAISAENNLFIATAGTTPVSEILDAYLDGKAIACWSSSNKVLYQLAKVSINSAHTIARFEFINTIHAVNSANIRRIVAYTTSEGWQSAEDFDIQKVLDAGKGILISTSEEEYDRISVGIDNKTLVINSEGLIETAIGGWVEQGGDVEVCVNGTPTIPTDYQSNWDVTPEWTAIENKPATIEIYIEGEMDIDTVGSVSFSDTVTMTNPGSGHMWDGTTTIGGDTFGVSILDDQLGNDLFSLHNYDTHKILSATLTASTMSGAGEVVHYVDNKFIKIDGTTILLDSEGALTSTGLAEIDEKTIILNSEGELSTAIGGWLEEAVVLDDVLISSEGQVGTQVAQDKYRFTLNYTTAKKVANLDNFDIKFDAKMTVAGTEYPFNDCWLELEKSGTNEWYYSTTIGGQTFEAWYVLKPTTGEAHLDLFYDYSGYVQGATVYNAKFAVNIDEVVHYVDNKFIKVDNDTIKVNSEGELQGNIAGIDNKTIILDSEGMIQTRVSGWLEEGFSNHNIVAIGDGESTSGSSLDHEFMWYGDYEKFKNVIGLDSLNIIFSGEAKDSEGNIETILGAPVQVTRNSATSWYYSSHGTTITVTANQLTSRLYILLREDNGLYEYMRFDWRLNVDVGDTIHYIDSNYIHVDNSSIVIDSEGIISATATSPETLTSSEVDSIWNSLI